MHPRCLHEAALRIPVVMLADDVADSGRLAYVGPDDRRAGRVAGDLLGRLLRPDGGHTVMIAGLRSMAGHRERETGFRSVLAEFYPETRVIAVLESRDDAERAGLLVLHALKADPQGRGMYPVVQALRRLNRADTTVLITHELTDNHCALLRRSSTSRTSPPPTAALMCSRRSCAGGAAPRSTPPCTSPARCS